MASAIQKLVYMRQFPQNLIAFSSMEGKQIFREALCAGTMECYFPLAEQFVTQLHPTTCGATTLVMVLNSLKVDPQVQWKGIWRWYTEENLHGLTNEHLLNGIDLDAFEHIAEHNRVQVQTFYHPSLQVIKYRSVYDCQAQCQKTSNAFLTACRMTFELCLEASARRDNFFMVVNNSRQALGQTGEGHFNPVGGIHLERKLALLMDVARFKYPPNWCHFDMLYNSFQPIDQDTQMTRGFSLIANPELTSYDSYSLRDFHSWLKTRDQNQQLILPKSLQCLLVYYLFNLNQRINQGTCKLQTNVFHEILLLDSKYSGSLDAGSEALILDFTRQYPDLLSTISILLVNLIQGHNYTQQFVQDEISILKSIIQI